jgi:hypothetical protein
MRDALRDDEVLSRIEELRDEVGQPHLAFLRVVDIVVWMQTWGANEPRQRS